MRDETKRAQSLSARFEELVQSLGSQEAELVALERANGPVDPATPVPAFLNDVFEELAETVGSLRAVPRSAPLRGFVVRG